MSYYAIAPSANPLGFNWSGFGLGSPEPQVRTPPPQARPVPTQRTRTQFTVVTGYVTNFFDQSPRIATAPIASAAVGWEEVETPQVVSETIDAAAVVGSKNAAHRDVDDIAGERMVLLARKYADLHSPETVARLEKLNGLLLAIAPRVSDEQVAALVSSRELLERAEGARAERARRRAMRVEA